MKKILLTISFFLLFASGVINAQSIDKISARCPSPNQSTFANIIINNLGDLVYTPCNARASIFNGNVDFTNAVVTGAVTGSGTINFLPRWTAASVLGNTPNSWNGTSYLWQNTALTGLGTMKFTPGTTLANSVFNVGGTNTTLGIDVGTIANNIFIGDVGNFAGFNYSAGSGNVTVNGFGTTGTATLGSSNNASAARIDAARGTNTVTFFTSIIDLSTGTIGNANHVSNIKLPRTITPAGTTGDQTINNLVGTVNFAALATDIVVTNSTATTTSIIFCTVQGLDATAISCRVTDRAAGSFHIRIPAATAETPVGFWVTN